jgi:hypothetical protein
VNFPTSRTRSGTVILTRSINEALSGKADSDKNGSVSIQELRNYVADEVAKKTGDLQHPTVDRDNINIRMALPYHPVV